jgi:soluble lytic murein transglycosylase-like protein
LGATLRSANGIIGITIPQRQEPGVINLCALLMTAFRVRLRCPPWPAFRLVAVVGLWFAASGQAFADCINQAATYHQVNGHVLRAIGWHESRLKPEAIGRNTNGTLDIGAFQINSIHLNDLARYGIDQKALTDGCVSAYVGAWHYRKQINQYGNTWFAVGAYHSRTPARAAWYANQIARQLMQWGIAPAGPLPFPAEGTLAPGVSQRSAGAARTDGQGVR